MDAFEDCPPEVRLRIIESIETREDVSALSLASPAIFQQRKADRKRIIRTFVSRNLDREHLDEALAVIFFPRCDAGSYDRKLYNHAHLKRWASGELSIPLNEMDVLLLLKLDSFCQRIWLLTDDFLSKAIAPSLPEAYRAMPRVPAKSLWPGFSSDGLVWSWQRRKFDISKLTECEMGKIFKSFVRYEMICKIYGPQRKQPANYPDGVTQCDTATFRKIDVHLCHWK